MNTCLDQQIQLLPDHIANQIAAGEVIQRPASAVKELLENAVDAGATEIRLIVNDAGKALIQVVDNGKGMNELDARMCFERHATSKIRNINDLFQIRTMGFRGEALASIAAVSQVELKTRTTDAMAGIYLEVENSKVVRQEPIAWEKGTSIAMKNLFFNVPARRNFLKSNNVELRHIVDEFIRVAMAFPGIFFSLTSNGQQVMYLEPGSLKQRIVQILGNTYASKLVAIQEQTDYMNIYGFVGKPETARKTRGDQYFFVNNRFIRSAYLNHALAQAFEGMISKENYPMYALFIDLDPAQVDINVHPTKQEIKFEDEKIIYAFVQSAVKHALAQFSITPTLDFELDAGIQQLDAVAKPFTESQQQRATGSSLYSTFTQKHQAHRVERNQDPAGSWKNFFESPGGSNSLPPLPDLSNLTEQPAQISLTHTAETPDYSQVQQINNCFLLFPQNDALLIIHQQNAHERILYERFIKALDGKPIATQQSLFPATLEFAAADVPVVTDLLPELHQLGYLLEPFGKNCFLVQGTPADVLTGNEQQSIELIMEQYKHFSHDLRFSKREKLIRSMALQQAVKAGTRLTQREIIQLMEALFQCDQPGNTPSGRPVIQRFNYTELNAQFGR